MTAGVQQLFDYVTYQMRITVDGQNVYLNHFPFLCFAHGDPKLYSDNNLFYALSGHTHIRKEDTGSDSVFTNLYKPTQYDVGVDLNSFTPISWEKVNERIQYQIANKCNITHWL